MGPSSAGFALWSLPPLRPRPVQATTGRAPAAQATPSRGCFQKLWWWSCKEPRWHPQTAYHTAQARRWPCLAEAVRLHAGARGSEGRDACACHMIRPPRASSRTRSEVYGSGLSRVDRLAQVLRWSSIRTVPGGPGQSRAARSVPAGRSIARVSGSWCGPVGAAGDAQGGRSGPRRIPAQTSSSSRSSSHCAGSLSGGPAPGA